MTEKEQINNAAINIRFSDFIFCDLFLTSKNIRKRNKFPNGFVNSTLEFVNGKNAVLNELKTAKEKTNFLFNSNNSEHLVCVDGKRELLVLI